MQQEPGSELPPVDEEVTYKTAVRNTALAVAAACAFGLGLGAVLGVPKATEFFTGYVVEESLSVDNLFVFILLFEVRPRRTPASHRARGAHKPPLPRRRPRARLPEAAARPRGEE